MIYNWIYNLIGITSNTSGQNSTVIYISGFMVVMLFIVSLDILINGIFSFFSIRERRK